MIRTAEAGVFAAMDTGKVYETEMESYEIAEFISYKYIGNAFRRGELFQESIYSPVGNLELSEFYAAAVLVVFLLMSGVNCGFLYKQESRAGEQRMYANGLGAVSQATVKIVAMLSVGNRCSADDGNKNNGHRCDCFLEDDPALFWNRILFFVDVCIGR